MNRNQKAGYLITEVGLIAFLFLFEIIHIYILFDGAGLLAGGDNYVYLQLFLKNVAPYYWSNKIVALGSVNFAMPDVLGLQLYSVILGFLSPTLAQKILIFSLYFFRDVALFKLLKLICGKISIGSIVPVLFLFEFNAFSSLDPFSLFPLMYAVYLPFSLYYFIKLSDSETFAPFTILKLVLLSIIFVPLNSNVALSVTIFIPQILYVLLFVKSLDKNKVVNIVSYWFLWLLFNAWWVLPLFLYFYGYSSSVFSANWLTFTGLPNTFMNFRFLGQWGWYVAHYLHYYYPFSVYYDNYFVVLFTYFLIGFSFLSQFKESRNKYRVYFLLLSVIGLFLVGGPRPPLGFVYDFLLKYAYVFKIFREPFTKFGMIYVLSICVLLYISLSGFEKWVRPKYKLICFAFIYLAVFISIKPSLFGEHVWDKWNANMRTFRVKIPEYWLELAKFVDNAGIQNARILTIPEVQYGTAWNWPYGFSSADDVAPFFVGSTNLTLRNPVPSVGGSSGEVISSVFKNKSLDKKYLSLLGIRYVLLENDIDWRFGIPKRPNPTENTKLLEDLGYKKISDFGLFTEDYISKIKNDEPDEQLRKQMRDELLKKPALSLYKVDEDSVLPVIYTPDNVVYSTGSVGDISDVFEAVNPQGVRNVFYLGSDDLGLKEDILSISNRSVLYPQRIEDKIDLNSVVWQDDWIWPEVYVGPTDKIYKLLRLKEDLDLATTINRSKKLDKLIRMSSKRISEIRKYEMAIKTRQDLIDSFIENVDEEIEVAESLNSAADNQSYWNMINKLLMYSERSFGYLSSLDNFALHDNPRIFEKREKLLRFVFDLAKKSCGEFCFNFVVPEDNTYKLFVNNVERENIFLRKESITEYELGRSDFLDSLEILDPINKFSEIVGWETDKEYKMSFDYRTNTDALSFTIVEGIIDNRDLKKKYIDIKRSTSRSLVTMDIKDENEQHMADTRYCKYIYNGECYAHYEQSIRSGSDASAALISFSFATTQNPIRNLRVEKIKDYSVKLVGRSKTTDYTSYPTITFVKLNPTKYRVYVENAISDYLIVFNENFDTNWKAYYAGKIDENILANLKNNTESFFGGKIRGVVQNIPFLNASIFETFGKKKIDDRFHYTANGYANSWLVKPSFIDHSTDYELIIEYIPQRYFYIQLVLLAIVTPIIILSLFGKRVKNE